MVSPVTLTHIQLDVNLQSRGTRPLYHARLLDAPVPVFLAMDYPPVLQVCLPSQNHWLEKTHSSVPLWDSLVGLIVQIYCSQ